VTVSRKKSSKTDSRRQCMRCLTRDVRTHDGKLEEHVCPHGKKCSNRSTGGPRCDKCRAELEIYWTAKREL